MASQQQQHAPGGHYSGRNPIPTVRQFVENLDKDKAARDKELDEQAKQQQQQQSQPHKQQERKIKGTEKTVTDPTTGREVVIADVNEDMIGEVENPHLVVPNANLNKQTVRLYAASRQLL
jgi:tRNA(Glu) U13 pseudouridine synthase TruD